MDRRDIYLRQVAKYGIFVLSVFVLYILQSAPGFLSIFGIKPVLILPFCVALSMLDESWQAGIVYIVGGFTVAYTELPESSISTDSIVPIIRSLGKIVP